MAKSPKKASKKAPEKAATKRLEHNVRLCAALGYIIIGIIWYFADEKLRKDAFATFHAKQALVLLIAWAIVNVAGWFLPVIFAPIFWALHLGLFVLMILGIIHALDSKRKELPVIGQFAKNLRW